MAGPVSASWARDPMRQAAAHASLARAGTVTKPAASPADGRALGGFTSQGWPVVVEVSSSGKQLGLVGTTLGMSCTSGVEFPLYDGWRHLAVGSAGKVHVAFTVPPSPGSPVSITGGTDSFSGTLDRRRATFVGSWDLQLSYSMSDGTTDQCDSGQVTLRARL
jgi:hypothetical protein